MRDIEDEKDGATVEKARLVLAWKDRIANIQVIHRELVDWRIRAIEASSEVAQLQAKNQEVTKKLDEMQQTLKKIDQSIDPLKTFAHQALNRVREVISSDERKDFLTELAKRYETMDGIDEDIEVERSKLELIHAANPNAIREFEERTRDIDRLTMLKAQRESSFEEISQNITRIRDQWEPELDALVGRINDAFSYNFEQISCAGEVGVHKDEDFDKWAIEIKVKFRENETLQRLDQHRQSGGERAVSTIFYLMSLQSMAQAPFRVVDEINQGMDPRNERMVHERMVEIACREHTSQYFLITPKLLSGLKYDERMRVLCIASGEHMPEESQGKKLDFNAFVKIQQRLVAASMG
jgi:chromosome segregation ATPase